MSVSDTFIFARLTGGGSQYLAYEMKYESEEPNAMILPLPVALPAGERSIRFIDLSGYDNFFEDLSRAFPYIPKQSLGCSTQTLSKGAVDKLQLSLIHI